MFHSTLTSKGQTTIPKEIREALKLAPGDRLIYTLDEKGSVRLEVVHGATALKGRLASNKGQGMTFEQIRRAAADKRR